MKLTSRRVEFSETASFICHFERIALHLRIEFRAVFRFSLIVIHAASTNKTKYKQVSVLISAFVSEGDSFKMAAASQLATRRDVASHSLTMLILYLL